VSNQRQTAVKPKKEKQIMKKSAVPTTHANQTFRIPGKLHANFEIVERWLQSEANRQRVTISQVVEAMLLFASKEVKANRVQFPQFSQCRRNRVDAVFVEIPKSERSGPPPTFPKPTPRHERPSPAPRRIVSYRIAPNVADWVRRMAGDYFAIGEMLLILLSHSMTVVQEGRAQLKVNFSVEIEFIANNPASNGSEE
jgi:hypothetical protein